MCFCQTCSTVSCQWVCYSLNDRKLEIKRWPGGLRPQRFIMIAWTHLLRHYYALAPHAVSHGCSAFTTYAGHPAVPLESVFQTDSELMAYQKACSQTSVLFGSLVVDVTTNALHPNSKWSSLYIRCSLQLQLLFHSISAFSVRALHPPHSLMVPFVPRDLARPTSRCWDLWWKTELLIQVSLHLPVLDSIQEYSSHSCRLICYTFTCSHICGRCLQVQEQGKGWHSGNSCSRSRMTAK